MIFENFQTKLKIERISGNQRTQNRVDFPGEGAGLTLLGAPNQTTKRKVYFFMMV
jgi:hypothetical protein